MVSQRFPSTLSPLYSTHGLTIDQVNCWPRLETTETFYFGYPPRMPPYMQRTLEKMAWKTRKHGEPRQCVARRDRKFMIWPGPRTASTSSLAAWTMSLASTMPRQVCSVTSTARPQTTDNLTGSVIRQVAEHNHYVQGVAWDPLNEYIATQSSDRSVHVYTLKTKDGSCTLTNHNKISKMDMPARRVSQSSPAPPDFRGRASFVGNESPAPSAPGTPLSLALPMNPPQTTHSRRSSFGSVSVSNQSMRRSVSPSPSMPLPAVMPSASPSIGGGLSMPSRSTGMYANETFTSFFRRLTFAPDGSLLFTPAGQHKENHGPTTEPNKADDVVNMTYIYTRAGLNKPPVAKLPGHKKPSLAVKCSPIFYTLRASPVPTKDITIDTHMDDEIPFLPEPVVASKSTSSMEPPPIVPSPAPSHAHPAPIPSPRTEDGSAAPTPLSGPPPVFDLPYRIVYAVATQDSVHVYDTQQSKPLCVVSNLHYATFTDLTW